MGIRSGPLQGQWFNPSVGLNFQEETEQENPEVVDTQRKENKQKGTKKER